MTNTYFYWTPFTGCVWLLVAAFYMVKAKRLKKRTFIANEKSIYREAFEKRISQKDDLINCFSFFFSSFCSVSSSFSFNIWLRSKISWVEKLRNNRLNINNKKLCCLTQTGRDVQKSQFLVLCNYWIATNRYQDYLKSHLYSLTLGGLVWSAVISDDLGCL